MGAGVSSFTTLSNEDKVKLFRHVQHSCNIKLDELGGQSKEQRIKKLRAMQVELKKNIRAIGGVQQLIVSPTCASSLSLRTFIIDTGMDCDILERTQVSEFSATDAAGGQASDTQEEKRKKQLPRFIKFNKTGEYIAIGGRIKNMLIEISSIMELNDRYFSNDVKAKVIKLLDFRDDVLYPRFKLAVEPLLYDNSPALYTMNSEHVQNMMDACNLLSDFIEQPGFLVGSFATLADFAILPILRCMQITEHVGWELLADVDEYTHRCFRVLPQMRACFTVLERRVNHLSPRGSINGEATLQLHEVLENSQKQSFIVSLMKGGEKSNYGGQTPEEWAATKLQARFRGYLSRKNRKELVHATTTFQAQWRGYQARKLLKCNVVQSSKNSELDKEKKVKNLYKRRTENSSTSFYFSPLD